MYFGIKMIFYNHVSICGVKMVQLLKAGDFFAGYKIITLCGKGAFGIVYLAEDPVGRNVIIKIIESSLYSGRELEGLRNYMQVSGKHPNLLRIFHVGKDDNGIYYTMEAADNCQNGNSYLPATLGNIFRLNQRLSPEEAIKITRELLAGLKVMHDENLIHRDIKPDNIIFVNGQAKLSDPGLVAEAGQSVSFAGTIGFIPPEAFEHEMKPDPSIDLYAIGKVFYCMLTGYSPGQYPQLPLDMRLEVCRQVYPALNRMCNRNPAKRFKNVDEFLKNLPEKVEAPNFRERLQENFRSWKALNQELYRNIQLAVLSFILLVACGAAVWKYSAARQAEKELYWQRTVNAFTAINKERPELVDFQMQVYLPEKVAEYRTLNRQFQDAYQKKQWKNAARISQQLKLLLENSARILKPEIPQKSISFQKDFDAAGTAHSFLDTPLAGYLDSRELNDFKKQLSNHEKQLYPNWTGVRCGREWISMQEYYAPMSFVPAGAVKMQHSGEIVKIPYYFWMCQKEMCHEQFTRILDIAPQFSTNSNTPVERCIWNDVLFYCWIKTNAWKNSGILPPGYIVRPPTEVEWEYAAQNAWLGKDDIPFEKRAFTKQNSKNRTWPSGTLAPNKLGLYDIYGNVREMVIPYTESNLQNSIITRGGSFIKGNVKRCFHRKPHLKMQNIHYDAGFRIVIAPGTMEFFDRYFYLTEQPAQVRSRGKVYEAIGGNLGSLDWENSRRLCELLGGRLAEFEDKEQMEFIRGKIMLAGKWDTFVGGEKINGKWRWRHSGREINWGNWKTSRQQKDYDKLAFCRQNWVPVQEKLSGVLLCEWDEKNYEQRNNHLKTLKKLPFEVMRFAYGDKVYVLFDFRMVWYTAQRVCELLGGRLASLDTPEKQEYAKKMLKPYQHGILLGGYRKRNDWFWLSGKTVNLKLERDKDQPIPTQNRNFVTLKNGTFFNSQYGYAFLCEFPAGSLAQCD